MKILRRVLDFLSRQPPVAILIFSVMLVAGTGLVDYYNGLTFSTALFYIVPVALAAWYVGAFAGLSLSVLSGLSLFLADWVFLTGTRPFSELWNAVFPFFFFVVFVGVLVLFKRSLARETLLSRTDPLTGLWNRRYFYELVTAEVEIERRYGRPASFAFIDLDNFKKVNDTMGHEEGDEVLLAVANILKEHLRSTDSVARLGGDEFAVLLPESGPEASSAAIGKVRRAVADTARERKWPVTLSIGLVTYEEPPASAEAMLKEADNLMYEIKDSTKDAVSHKVVEGPGVSRTERT